MNRSIVFLAVLVLILTFGVAGNTFSQVYENSWYPTTSCNDPSGVHTPYANVQNRAGKIIGAIVMDQRGGRVGKVKDLLLDPTGRVAFAILKPAWGMGFGFGRYVAVPMSTLTWDQTNQDFVLSIPRDRLAQAPSFDRHHWPNMGDTTWDSNVYRFYGITPYSKPE